MATGTGFAGRVGNRANSSRSTGEMSDDAFITKIMGAIADLLNPPEKITQHAEKMYGEDLVQEQESKLIYSAATERDAMDLPFTVCVRHYLDGASSGTEIQIKGPDNWGPDNRGAEGIAITLIDKAESRIREVLKNAHVKELSTDLDVPPANHFLVANVNICDESRKPTDSTNFAFNSKDLREITRAFKEASQAKGK